MITRGGFSLFLRSQRFEFESCPKIFASHDSHARAIPKMRTQQSVCSEALTEGMEMGAVKEMAMEATAAGMTLIELQRSGVRFVLTGEDSWSWFIAPEGDEYDQDDWIFHALRRGQDATFDGAVTALAQAVVVVLPDTTFAQARTPALRRVK